jgi:hypothetical protein
MASSQSMAHARLMGAISRKRNRQSASTDLPEPNAPEGILFSEARSSKYPGESRYGRPGSRGSRLMARGSRAQGLPEGTRRKPDTDGRANLRGVRYCGVARGAATEYVSYIWFAASRGSTDAGGEDFGYFALGKAGSNPAFDVTHRGSGLAKAARAPGSGFPARGSRS